MNISDKLILLKETLNEPYYKVAKRLGVSREYVSALKTGTAKSKPSSQFEKLLDSLLASSSVREFESSPEGKKHANYEKLQQWAHHQLVPVVSMATAGKSLAFSGSDGNFHDLADSIEERVATDCRDPNAFALIIEGDSMEPDYRAGDRVIFAPNLEPRNGDFVVVRIAESGRVLFKKFFRKGPEGAMVRLESLNPEYPPIEMPGSAFRFIYPAWDVVRRIRRN